MANLGRRFIQWFLHPQTLGDSHISKDQHAETGTISAHAKSLTPANTSTLPPLNKVSLRRILPDHQHALSEQGWTTITYDSASDPLKCSVEALFKASRAFFDLPISYKQNFGTKLGSEEGWSRVEGEKEFITLRSLDGTPEELKDAAVEFWKTAGGLLNGLLGGIAETLGLEPGSLMAFSKDCVELGSERTETMLRLFRYEGSEGPEPHIVAEAHRDLGLLSLVFGDTPGLEVWNTHYQCWYPIERSYVEPAGSLLVGRQLERLSNKRYSSGGHLVRSYPDIPESVSELDTKPTETVRNVSKSKYRYSIVFVLRAHGPVPINTEELTTAITGRFLEPIKDTTARELFKGIQKAHFNINTSIQEREEQRRKLAEQKTASATALP